MKIICISDTHLHHKDLNFSGDLIIHCGDCTCRGYLPELNLFIEWYSKLNFKYKVMIPGNHDWIFENSWSLAKSLCEEKGIICLNDSGVEIEGIKIWGSPITPWFHNWAFNRMRGDEIQRHWDMIPDNIDILITHGPPSDVGDLSMVKISGDVGCKNLKQTVDRIKPKYHLFGHIHEGYGIYKENDITFINCSQLSKNYEDINKPIEINYDK